MTTPDLAGLCERLREPSNWLMQPRGKDWKSVVNQYDRAPFEAAAAIERLVAALEPFARRADYFDAVWGEGGSDRAETSHPIGDFRRARTALQGASDDR